jgi:hypothetical protein
MTKKSPVQAAAASLAKAEQALQQLLAQRERCEQAASLGAGHETLIADLRRQKAEAEGKAFLTGQEADVSKLEAQIAEAEKQDEAVRATARAAMTAAELLRPQIDAAQKALDAAQDHLSTAVAESMQQLCDQAEDEYHQAVATLKGALARMGAAAAICNRILGAQRNSDLWFQLILDSLSGDATGMNPNGLVVKSPHGGYWVDPDIRTQRLTNLIDKAMDAIVADLAAQGVGV